MALAIDPSTPALFQIDSAATTGTPAAFSPPDNSTIFVFFSMWGPSLSTQSVSSMTDSLGTHLNWSLYTGSRDNLLSTGNLTGTTEVWWAYCPTAQTNMTITATYAHANNTATSSNAGMIQVVVFTGASTSQGTAASIRNSSAAATPSQTLTTTVANSWVFGILQDWTNGTAPTVGSGQTTTINGSSGVDQNISSNDAFWLQTTTATTSTAGTVVTINDTAPTSIVHHFSLVEVVPATSLSIDSSTKVFTNANNTPADTAITAISPPAQSVIYLFVAGTGPVFSNYSAQAVASITDNVGANLNWTLAARDNCADKSATGGTAEVWWAYCPNAQTNMQLTITMAALNSSSGNIPAGLIQAVVFTGAKANQAGAATAIRNSTGSGLPSLSLTTTAAGSWVMGIVQNWTNATTPTIPATQTNNFNGTTAQIANGIDGDAFWVQRQQSATVNAGTSVTINDTAPSVVSHMAIVEVLADQPMLTPWIQA